MDELRRAERMAMVKFDERIGLSFAQGGIEMRAKSNGTAAGSNFEWTGYASVYDADFPMWDRNGEPYVESVAFGASRRSLANPALDVPFVFGHSEYGIPLARTKSGTMKLAEDKTGLHVHVPAMDGHREDVRALASAVDRGDVDEMSLAFVTTRQDWSPDFERRTILEWDLHRGDVSAVIHGANPATAGAQMFPVEQLMFRRPAVIGGPRLLDQHPYELLAVTQADRDNAHAAGNSLPDKSYPINNVAQLHAAAVLAASHHGDWQAAQTLIRRRAKELGVDVTTLPGFGAQHAASGPYELRAGHEPVTVTHSHPHPAMGSQGGDDTHDHEHAHDGDADHGHHAAAHAASEPLETRASAAEDMNLAASSDYDAAAAPHPLNGAADGEQWECAPHAHFRQPSAGTGATVVVDGSTGFPGDEVQMSDQAKRERRLRELELEELAAARIPSLV